MRLYLLAGSLERYIDSLRFGLVLLWALSSSFGACCWRPLTADPLRAIWADRGDAGVEHHPRVPLLDESISGLFVLNLVTSRCSR